MWTIIAIIFGAIFGGIVIPLFGLTGILIVLPVCFVLGFVGATLDDKNGY